MPRSPRRVCLSHTSDLRTYPPDGSYVDYAERAVVLAGHAVLDMEYLPACSVDPAVHSAAMVRDADVYVGIIGTLRGSTVRERPGFSFTELEYETAAVHEIPRLVFLLPWSGPDRVPSRQTAAARAQQSRFRQRLAQEEGLTIAYVSTPSGLHIAVYHALVNLPPTTRRRGHADR